MQKNYSNNDPLVQTYLIKIKLKNVWTGLCQVHGVNKEGLLLEVVQVLTDMNLQIWKGYISSDADWFMDGTS